MCALFMGSAKFHWRNPEAEEYPAQSMGFQWASPIKINFSYFGFYLLFQTWLRLMGKSHAIRAIMGELSAQPAGYCYICCLLALKTNPSQELAKQRFKEKLHA